jgi:hypothetical protein
LAHQLASAKVRSLDAAHDPGRSSLPGEVDYERRRLANPASGVFGILYDAHELCRILASLLPARERGLDSVHVVFTNQLIGTWDESDRRYHARTLLMGSPAIVSISGLVEAPAKAPGYYVARRSAEALGLAEEKKMELAAEFAEECLHHGDPRLTEALKGYVLQAVAYRMTGIPFCEDPDCRLYNSHWQKELIRSQLGKDQKLCPRHQELFTCGSERGGESLWTSDYMS